MSKPTNGHGKIKGVDWSVGMWKSPAPPDGRRRVTQVIDPLAKQEDFDCLLMGEFGMAIKTISERTSLTPGQVYLRLRKHGIRVSDFRQGRGPYAQMVFQYLGKRAARLTVQQLRERAIEI